jgi:steroid 5-alpha reductase family enzyme
MKIGFILLLLFVVCLIITTIGFKKYVWFLSIGYGLSVAGEGIALIILFAIEQKLTILGLLALVLFIVYGIRLGGFLLLRELKNAGYRNKIQKEMNTEKKMPVFVLITMWISVCVLYVAEVSGVTFALNNAVDSTFFSFSIVQAIGCLIMLLAVIIEATSDQQKTLSKKANPNQVAMNGLYKFCRCPNYFGEILFWTGTIVFCCTSLSSVWQWVLVLFGYICIVYVMLNGAKRLEKRQDKNYGQNEEYLAYCKKTPLIYLLFIPIHSLKNSKVIK